MEVLRRTSNHYGVLRRVSRLTRHLEGQGRAPAAAPRSGYSPHKLSQPLSAGTVTEMLAAYQAGATTRQVGQRFGLAHSSVNKLLKQHEVELRRRGPRGESKPSVAGGGDTGGPLEER